MPTFLFKRGGEFIVGMGYTTDVNGSPLRAEGKLYISTMVITGKKLEDVFFPVEDAIIIPPQCYAGMNWQSLARFLAELLGEKPPKGNWYRLAQKSAERIVARQKACHLPLNLALELSA